MNRNPTHEGAKKTTRQAKRSKSGGISYAEWMQQLNSVALVWGYKHAILEHDDWRAYYDDDLSPEQALREDESHAL